MPTTTRIVKPGPSTRIVRTDEGQDLEVPKNWKLLPPGDATLTRRVKATGPTWTVQEKKGRKIFLSRCLGRFRTNQDDPRGTRRRAFDGCLQKETGKRSRSKREEAQGVCRRVRAAVHSFLDFDSAYDAEAATLAEVVTAHATPVGSGTVARTERIPLEQRAESAVIAWMRQRDHCL